MLSLKKGPVSTRDSKAAFGPSVMVKMDRKKNVWISRSRHGASKAVIHASVLSGQYLYVLSISLRLPNRGKLQHENRWVLI